MIRPFGVGIFLSKCYKHFWKHTVFKLERISTIEETILKSANIIACTLSSCYTSYKMKNVFANGGLQIPFCIIDEAAQATELLTLVPTLLRIQRLILVGDPQQLPPTILSNKFCLFNNRFKAKEYGYDSSLFARAQLIFEHELENPIVMLDTQYRMMDAIAQWPNRYFYAGLLKNAASVAPLDFYNYKVLNHSFSQDADGRSNPNEAVLVANLIRALREKSKLIESEKEITIGVITPYQNQRKLINSMIKTLNKKKEQPKQMKIKKRSDKDEDDVDGNIDKNKNNQTENPEKENIDAKNNEEMNNEDCKENSDSEDSTDEDENMITDINNCDITIISEAAKLEMKKKFEKKKKDKRAQKKEKDNKDGGKKRDGAPNQKRIEVNTVDSFQGSECDIIVLSCVRSEGIGFVKDPNRLNCLIHMPGILNMVALWCFEKN
ncbi:Similar to Setx: Probable helicase senataxin (Mus musculus) [Cotesia congregata]|uniref:Similar to Setx: Probable helicase senataxin (Mus musculus) n=1 Tax=Cotesia congregata TaxID=51543 RepID=A0A8J2MN93_COTCN|nr:Similar to Setx: Probable helicase senataxin (Mus musculus) [Cotesia congregata]